MVYNALEIIPNKGKFLVDKDKTIKVEATSFLVHHMLENWFVSYNKFTGIQVPVVISPRLRNKAVMGQKRSRWLLNNLKPMRLVRLHSLVDGSDFSVNHPELVVKIKEEYNKLFRHGRD
jgi:hypothetical protein